MTSEFLSFGSSRVAGARAGGAPAGALDLPKKFDLFGIDVSATSYDEVARLVTHASAAGTPLTVACLAVHGLMLGNSDPQFGVLLNEFDIVAPDGQPLRFALNSFYRTKLNHRVYGPELTLRISRACNDGGVAVYLYGSRAEVVNALRDKLLLLYPKLRIVGCEPSCFRPLSPQEEGALIARINDSGAGVLFVGLGCPIQEKFAHAYKQRIRASQVCVGAAFDFHAGTKPMAPAWMQRSGLEWFFRLLQEPRRLWRRYLFTNSRFVFLFVRGKLFGTRVRRSPGHGAV